MTESMADSASKASRVVRVIALVFLALLVLAPIGAKLGVWPGLMGFGMLALSLVAGLLILIVNAIWLLRKPNPQSKRLIRQATLFCLPALIVLISYLATAPSPQTGPEGQRLMLHNVSTDLQNPPVFSTTTEQRRGDGSNPLDYTADTAAAQAILHPEIAPLNVQLTTEQAFQQALQTATALGWEVYNQDPQQGIIEATDSTSWFAFKDDVVIRISALERNTGSRIDLRSVSRVGGGDMGKNAERIQQFITTFNE